MSLPDPDELESLVERVPEGWSRVLLDERPYGLSRRTRADGKVVTIWAEALDGVEVVSANVWRTGSGTVLRPCEMPASEVVEFLRSWR